MGADYCLCVGLYQPLKVCIIPIAHFIRRHKAKLHALGRVAVFDMASLSAAEIEGRPTRQFHPDLQSLRERLTHSKKKSIHDIYEDIFRGGMPKLRATDLDRDRFYMYYINTYIERDIKDLAQVGKLNEFYDFLVYMAARTGQELKMDVQPGIILCMSDELIPYNRESWYCPVSVL